MRQDIDLYINNQLVELGEDFEVNMTYTVEQTTNPTAIKNNYSKTITIPATAQNNRIFENIWNMGSIYNGGFDLTKKADFQLFLNGDKMEEGYIKIDNIIKKGTNAEYKCTLFGGLGDFFYCLSTDADGNKLKLSDLDYGVDFTITVDANFVQNAWNALMDNSTEGTIYDHINFALCYNGIPDDFSADKVVMSIYNDVYPLPWDIGEDGDKYENYKLYVMADLRQEYDEWASRDLRSNLQRPVFRWKTLINAICDPNNNGGYTVNLDEDFFNRANPYWEQAWITLPLVPEMDDVSTVTSSVNVPTTNIYFNRSVQEYEKISVSVEGDGSEILIPFTLSCTANTTSNDELFTGVMSYHEDALNSTNTVYYNAPIAVQLVGYNKNTDVVAYYSDVEVFTSNKITDDTYSDGCLKLNVGGNENWHNGSFVKSGTTTTFNWEEGETYTLNVSGIDNIGNYDWYIQLSRYEYTTPYYRNTYGTHYFDCVWLSQFIAEDGNLGSTATTVSKLAYSTVFKVSGSNDEFSMNKRIITKQRLLGRDKTPLDYLLGYTKQMGLYFMKNPQEKTIDILTRRTFYRNNGECYDEYGYRDVINLEGLIDRGQEITIKPLSIEKKWYDLGLEINDNKYSKIYDTFTDIPYGAKRIDTGYEYVKEVDNLLKNNAYKAGMMVREKNAYMVNFRLPKNN